MATAAPLAIPRTSAPPEMGENRVLLQGVDWRTYCAIRELIDSPGVRMAFHKGVLEIMSPSRRHETIKKFLARLLEQWAIEVDVPLQGYGSTTFRRAARETGLEPDECYVLGGPLGEAPDIAIEVALTSGGLPKLPLYEALGVREVWFWLDDRLELHGLTAAGYEPLSRSRILPALDIDRLCEFARRDDQHEAVKAWRDALRPPR